MSDTPGLIQESLLPAAREKDEVYVTALAAYIDNPFYDITKVSIADYVSKKSPPEETLEQPAAVEI